MPTYTVFAPAGRLTGAEKQSIATAITTTHERVTGARAFFAQVVFRAIEPGDWFMGGVPMEAHQVFVHGQIRGGRPAAMKRDLVLGLRDAVVAATGLPARRVWTYLVELPPSHMVEYGHVLPEPGDEAAWLAALPEADRALMESLGR